MFKQSLRPISRTLPRSSLRHTHANAVRFNSVNNGSPKQSSNGLIVPLGVAALAIGGFAMYYVPLVHDNDDRAESKQAKPNTLKALSPYQGDVRKSVLDQDSLKEPLHKSSHGATPSAKDKEVSTNIPSVVEDKASEAQEPAQTAFNEETGEINWDCPCLGGMADGPCGEQFKAAFSCFIYSEKEPKGVECVDKFQGMQDCFRQHPDIYGEEIEDDEEGYHPESVGNAGGEIDKEAIDPRPDSQKNRKMEPVKRTPPPDLGHHKMNQDNSVKGVAKLVPSKNRADKVDAPGNTSSGENTVPKEQKKRSGNDE